MHSTTTAATDQPAIRDLVTDSTAANNGDAIAAVLGDDPQKIELYDAAVDMLRRGLPIVVCDGKHPRDTMGRGWHTTTVNVDVIPFYFRKAKKPAIGLKLGPTAGIIDIEMDSPDEERAYAALFDGCDLPITPSYASPRGRHVFFRWDDRLAATHAGTVTFKTNDGASVTLRIGADGLDLAVIAQNMAELRNLYGTGHGRHGDRRGLSARHGRLIVGAATTLVGFLFETHAERIAASPRAEPSSRPVAR